MIKDLPKKLKELRAQNGFSQRQVALRIGVSPSIVSGYETGERTPSTENILALSYLYKCSTDYLLGRSIDRPDMILDATGLTPGQIQALRELVRTMKEGL